ncbi:MAG: hypothetical protein LBS93_00745 [Synergistaceae bacterium]|jgi:hypothetical protein|nr:hypothetical protein [Synergistaceae bacterium]
MRAFSMIGLIVSLLIVGWLSASNLVSATGGASGVTVAPAVQDSQPGVPAPPTPIGRANELVSKDNERQRMMEDLMKDQ